MLPLTRRPPEPVRGRPGIPGQTQLTVVARLKHEDSRTHASWVKHHKKRNYAVIGFVTVLLAIIILALASSPPPTGPRIGERAPDFNMPDIQGKNFHLETVGTPVLLEFMTTSCHFCTEQAPILSELWTKHVNQVAFVSISIDPTRDQPSVLSAYAQTHNMPWTWVRDTSGLAQTYGITGTPTIFLLDKDCMVKSRFEGVKDHQTLENGVKGIL